MLEDHSPTLAQRSADPVHEGWVGDGSPRPILEPSPDLGGLLAPLGLSAREVEVVQLLMKGFSNKEIASRLFISTDTVKKHTYNVYRKLGVQNRVQLSYFVRNQPAPTPSSARPQD